ncbi:hypothetical protein [Rufibacter sp. LB8]|uniref:hypothetical protein n=1 Tax=Rufibacter sp. LB8 TaxID=2777781 RepID=UPI00178C40EA|nr:hypothetical protein [Rufibacter sp. LB8]
MKKYILVVALATSFLGCKPAQRISPIEAVNKLGPNPHFIIDGQASDKSAMQTMEAEDVASLTTYFGKDATTRYGDKAKDGAVEIETKAFAKVKYQKVLKEASSDYNKRLEVEGSDDSFQYILNGKVLTDNYAGDLASITPDLLKEVKVVWGDELNSNFNANGKKAVVIIVASPPKNLYNGKEKFNQK